jgi:four helix bundle protein
MSYFRFEDLEIWQEAISLGDDLFDISELADSKKLFRFAEQLRGAGMSISNNIAEGAGSVSPKEFKNFLNISRRSVFECANIIIIYSRREIINNELKDRLLSRLSTLSKRITAFRRSLG